MAKKHYDWTDGPAKLQQHSVAKHKLLRSYLAAYFPTLISSPHQDELRLTIVDGFAGGGEYEHADTREIMLGSPFICLQAAEEAEAQINSVRTKKVRFNVDYVFVEKDRNAANYLKKTIHEQGYSSRIAKDIHLIHGEFATHAHDIIEQVRKKSPKKGRSIFILDQYGYSQIPMPLLAKIFQILPRAEVILTFNVDSFNSYASDKGGCSTLEGIGLPNIFEGRSLQDIKNNERNWRAYIQSQLYPHIVRSAGSRFHTPFFIRSTKGHGDFWLLHLSMHQKARDVMTEVHWEHGNTFIHYGGEGLDMFKIGYITKADERFTQQGKLGYTFDDDAKKITEQKLHEDIPRIIYADDEGQSYETLHATTCNDSPATSRIYKEVLSSLAKLGEIEIISPDGKRKTAAGQIKGEDRILPPRQRKLFV
ncbi:MAG: three-Cys-motif partner protein TcmP [Gallionella sp.]|nr:three-Cys-motif partner protein TcmP [Gallionella sp.]